MSLLDKLVKVNISISTAVADAESFDKILLVGPAPSVAPTTAPADVGVYASLMDIEAAGFKSTDPIYKAASIAFANGATELYVAIQKEAEQVDATLNRANEMTGWYGFAVCEDNVATFKSAATWADANNKLFGFTIEGTTNTVGSSFNYAFGFASKVMDDHPNNAYTHIALMCNAMRNVAGSETWAYKSLAGIEPENFTTTEIEAIKTAGLNCYVKCAGKSITLDGKTVTGEWIDVIRFRDWLLNDMQKRIYNALIVNKKVPYTSAGITLIENQMLASLKQGQANGGIAETEYDEDGNAIPGFTTSVPKATSVSEADKAARILKNCKFTARLAGAVHLVEVNGTLIQ